MTREPWSSKMSAQQRRMSILRSAGDVLKEGRADSLTMQQIADRLGMTKGSLYYYFKSKRDILFQCHMESTADSLRLMDEVGRMDAGPGARLEALIQRLAHRVIEEPYGAVVTANLAVLSASQRRRYVELRDRFEHGVRCLIEEGIACGEFRACDVKICGLAVLGCINSIAKWYDPKGARSAAEIAGTFSGLLVRGLRN